MREAFQKTRKWHTRDWFAGITLFAATAAVVFWQNAHVAVLWDLSYLLDTSWRIALGQVPYRDFPLVHPPLTFLIQAAILRMAGRVYGLQIAYAAVIGGLATLVTWRIILRLLRGRAAWAWPVALGLAAPLCVVGIYSIYPHPIYDCDCAFAVLVALSLLQRIGDGKDEHGRHPWVMPAAAGICVVLPAFFKQNIGLPFLLAVVIGAGLLLAAEFFRSSENGQRVDGSRRMLLSLLASIAAAGVLGVLLLQFTVGLGNYLQWTVRFAGQRRLPGLAEMIGVYRQPAFVWTIPALGAGLLLLHSRFAARQWARALGFALAAAPFAASLVFLFLEEDLDERADNLLALWPLLLLAGAACALWELRKGITLARLLPFFALAAIHGTFLSQQLWGSTYAIWPLLMILVAVLVAALPRASGWAAPAFAGVICLTFLVCGGLYAIGHERLNYVQLPDGAIERASLPALQGMRTPGPYLADFEELVRFAEGAIPREDGILLLPGEEPFFFATGRTPRFPVQIFDRTTDPYSAEELLAEARRRGIRWVVVKTRLQSNEDPLPERERTMELIRAEFRSYKKLAGYAIYRRP